MDVISSQTRLRGEEPGDHSDRTSGCSWEQRLGKERRRERPVCSHLLDIKEPLTQSVGMLKFCRSRPRGLVAPFPEPRSRLLGPGPGVARQNLSRPRTRLFLLPFAHLYNGDKNSHLRRIWGRRKEFAREHCLEGFPASCSVGRASAAAVTVAVSWSRSVG